MIYTHLIAAAIAALAAWFYQDNHFTAQISKLQLEHTQEVSRLKSEHEEADRKSAEETKRIVANVTTTYQGALNDARTREAVLRRDAGLARAESYRLRAQLSDAARRIADAPPATVAEYATTVGELLADCSRERTLYAEKADGHASDVRTLREAWPVISAPGEIQQGVKDAGHQD